jgi:hypothetical protein
MARAFDAAPPVPDGDSSEDQSAEQDWNNQISELERWAGENNRDACNDRLAFWALKIPAIIASASAGVWAQFHLTTISVLAGAIASVCVIIDGIHPRGMLRNTHLRAFHDIRILITGMTSNLRSCKRNPNNIRKIIREAEPERKRIATYVRDAEIALKPSDKG